ncbi:C4-dicarboxylate ABC transporter [Psychromonas sp. MB-3u-54]|nr:C4-dicarboxylate ABC transporter [Psychromonas sp. MB-3u-54]
MFYRTPSALAGLALGIASLGLCLENITLLQGIAQSVTALLASCLLLPLFCKFLFNPELLKQDLQHPLSGSLSPIIAMATMVIANNISVYYFQLGQWICAIALAWHFFLLVSFIYYRSKNFHFSQILPSWFIPPIGLVLTVLMFPGGLYPFLAEGLVYFGLVSYLLLLPVVLYRLIFFVLPSNNEKPIVVILATPASLLLLGYLSITDQPNYVLICLLGGVAMLMTIIVYMALIRLLRLPFTPAYSAFTFPLVVGAVALFKVTHFLSAHDVNRQFVNISETLAYGELTIATLMVIYVSSRYLLYFSGQEKYS